MSIDWPLVISAIALLISILGFIYTWHVDKDAKIIKAAEKRTDILSTLLVTRISIEELVKRVDNYLSSIPPEWKNTKVISELLKKKTILIQKLADLLNDELQNINIQDEHSIEFQIDLETIKFKVNELQKRAKQLSEQLVVTKKSVN